MGTFGDTSVGIVGAYGATGRVVAQSLRKATTAPLVVGGRDAEKAQGLANELGGPVEAVACDVFDDASLAAFCARAAVVVNCAGPYTRVLDRVARAALQAGSHYVDPGGEAATFERLEPLQEELTQRGLSFVLNTGWLPGVTGLIAWYANSLADMLFDKVDTLDLVFGDVDEWSTAASEDILSIAFDRGALGWYERGRWRRLGQAGALRASRRVDLPPPFGQRTLVIPHFQVELTKLATTHAYRRVAGFIAPQISPATLHRWGYIRAASRISRSHAANRLRVLMRDQTRRLGPRGVIQAQVKGERGGEPTRLQVTASDSRGYWITGTTCALAIEAVLAGTTVPGVSYLCDATDSVTLVHRLMDRGLAVTAEGDGGTVDAPALLASADSS